VMVGAVVVAVIIVAVAAEICSVCGCFPFPV
jgi:hypothetical protein